MSLKMEDIAIIGAGAWGTTLANLTAEKGHKVSLWIREKELANEINEKRENTLFLRGIKLNKNIFASNSLSEVVNEKKVIITAVPSQYLRSVLQDASKNINSEKPIIINVAKGIEHKTFKTMSMVIEEEIKIDKSVVVLSGPNHSEEVSVKLPTATVVASKDSECLHKVINIFSTDYFKVYPHHDIIGVEICGALKNITAIATGISSGLGYGDNAAGSIITLGLAEMVRVGKLFSAKRSTFYGLAGVGDLIATCASNHSRNRNVGLLIAKGKSLDEINHFMKGQVAEGVFTCKAVYDLSREQNIELPLTTEVYKILFEKKNLKESISDLIYFAK